MSCSSIEKNVWLNFGMTVFAIYTTSNFLAFKNRELSRYPPTILAVYFFRFKYEIFPFFDLGTGHSRWQIQSRSPRRENGRFAQSSRLDQVPRNPRIGPDWNLKVSGLYQKLLWDLFWDPRNCRFSPQNLFDKSQNAKFHEISKSRNFSYRNFSRRFFRMPKIFLKNLRRLKIPRIGILTNKATCGPS